MTTQARAAVSELLKEISSTCGEGPISSYLAEMATWTPEQHAAAMAEAVAQAKADRERIEREEHEKRERARIRGMATTGVPKKDRDRYCDGKFDVNTEAMRWVRKFADQLDSAEPKTMLVLSGAPGAGKTAAASWLLMERGDARSVFVDISKLTRWERFKESAMDKLESATVLCIDDMGSEFMDEKGALRSLLDGIINARYNERLPTVLTTNMRSGPFAERYGARIADRLREAGRFIELESPSMRGRDER